MAYPIYNQNSMYLQDLQNMRDRIDQQMRQFQQQMQPQMQPTSINQTFQLASNQNTSDLDGKYASNIDEVKNTLTLRETLFIDKEAKNLWIKQSDGSIRTYSLTEIVELDPKDKQIVELRKELELLKGAVLNAKQPVNRDVDEPSKNEQSSSLSTNKSTKK